MSKPIFTGKFISNVKPEETVTLMEVLYGNQTVYVAWPDEQHIKAGFTQAIFDELLACIKESFYRYRPDLRRQ